MLTLIKALQAGQELKNPARWKKGQNLVNSVAAIVAAIVAVLKIGGIDIPMTDEQLIEVSSIIAAILALINGYLTTASTKKIGLGGNHEENADNFANGARGD